MSHGLDLVVLGLTITSSWGNGHATTFRSLVRNLHALGHRVLFLERDVPWYASHRDAPEPEGCRLGLYASLADLEARFAREVADADAVIVGSYVPEGPDVIRWALGRARGVTAFYDIDTPVTLGKLARGDHEYLEPDLVPRFDTYLSFTGGPLLDRLERAYGARRARPLYCSVDPTRHAPVDDAEERWALGYLGTYSADRQPKLRALLLEVAARLPHEAFVVGGPSYPDVAAWPGNVRHVPHVAPAGHAAYYAAQRFTLNVTRAEMVTAGWSPSVRLFEAAACGVPLVSDPWPGLDTIFEPGREILVVRHADDVVRALTELDARDRAELAARARAKVLSSHTGRHRALELLGWLEEAGMGGVEAAQAARI